MRDYKRGSFLVLLSGMSQQGPFGTSEPQTHSLSDSELFQLLSLPMSCVRSGPHSVLLSRLQGASGPDIALCL